jgi:phosphohistidine phosphatase
MTIRFLLVRHARAEARHPDGDAARRLLPEGRAAFTAHARTLAATAHVVRIVTSPYTRAAETAAILAGATGAPVEEEAALGSGESSGKALLRLGASLGDGAALVGHNPEIAEAIALAAGTGVEVPAGTVAAIDADGGAFTLAWVRAPG